MQPSLQQVPQARTLPAARGRAVPGRGGAGAWGGGLRSPPLGPGCLVQTSG